MRVSARTLLALTLFAVFPLSTPGHASPLTGVEAMTSTVFQRDQSSFAGIGLRLNIEPPGFIEGLAIAPGLEYWRHRTTVETYEIEAVRKDATLTTIVRYDFSRQGWHPYFGVGLGLHFMSTEVDAPSLGLNNESDTLIKGGVLLSGGIGFGLARNLGNILEAEYHHLSDYSQFKLNWGLTWSFTPTGQ